MEPITPATLFERAERNVDDHHGDPPVQVVDLRTLDAELLIEHRDRRIAEFLLATRSVNIGIVDQHTDVTFAPLVDSFDVLVGSETGATAVIDVDNVPDEIDRLLGNVTASPQAAVELVRLLRLSHELPVERALHAESLVYAVLQTGEQFQTWLAARSVDPRVDDRPAVRLDRRDSLLEISLDRPERRNALNIAMRDGLAEAFALLAADRSIDGAILRGLGPNFCAGGDLDEFGTTPSPATGHAVRMERSVPTLLHRVADRVRVEVHGACVGAGIELPAFAHSVIADPDATFTLPEVGFGLVPGAGGTVSITRRCGRHRMAWLAITGETIDARTALSWGLIDRVA